LPNACGEADLADLDAARIAALMGVIGKVRPDHDWVVVDTRPGIGPATVAILREARVTIVVSGTEPTAITDTYALFKVLGEGAMRGPVGLVINQACSAGQACEAAAHLDAVAQRFLGRSIACWGHVPHDAAVARSIWRQQALWIAEPRSPAACAVSELAATIAEIADQE
jgi:flagellar biosynthesis protein FlhG